MPPTITGAASDSPMNIPMFPIMLMLTMIGMSIGTMAPIGTSSTSVQPFRLTDWVAVTVAPSVISSVPMQDTLSTVGEVAPMFTMPPMPTVRSAENAPVAQKARMQASRRWGRMAVLLEGPVE